MNHTINPIQHSLEITIPGDIVSTNADQVRTDIMALLESEPVVASKFTMLKLDMSAAKMVDSVGLNLIVGVYKEAKKRNAATAAVLTSPNIQRTFYFTRLDTHIQVIMAN
jgi:anti-anti-sigma factor